MNKKLQKPFETPSHSILKKETKFKTKIVSLQTPAKNTPKKKSEPLNDDNIFSTPYDAKLKGFSLTKIKIKTYKSCEISQ